MFWKILHFCIDYFPSQHGGVYNDYSQFGQIWNLKKTFFKNSKL